MVKQQGKQKPLARNKKEYQLNLIQLIQKESQCYFLIKVNTLAFFDLAYKYDQHFIQKITIQIKIRQILLSI